VIDQINHVFVVYNPGYAGNFLIRLFSLDTAVVPQSTLESINTEKFFDLSIEERSNFYSFASVRNQYLNWQKFHRTWMDFHHYEQFKSKLNRTHTYNTIIFSMHSPEYLRFQRQIESIKHHQIVFVDLDENRYSSWIKKSQKDLNFKYRLDETKIYKSLLDQHDQPKINLTAMLESTESFICEYLRMAEILNVNVHINDAVKLYKEWYETRVSYYL
jgi:hypothetical protein